MAFRSRKRTDRVSTATPSGGSRLTTRPGAGVVQHALHEQAVHFIPWFVLALFWLAGTLLHAFVVMTWSRIGTIVLILLATAGMSWSVWETNRSRTAQARWHGVLSTAFGGGWLALCTVTGFVTIDPAPNDQWTLHAHGFTIATFCVFGAALSAVWNARINARHRQVELAELMANSTPEPTPMELAGHKGAVLKLKRVNMWRSEGTLYLAPGDTLTEFQRHIESVETAHGFPPGSMTVTRRPAAGNAQICDVVVMHLNPIEDAQPWPGLMVGTK